MPSAASLSALLKKGIDSPTLVQKCLIDWTFEEAITFLVDLDLGSADFKRWTVALGVSGESQKLLEQAYPSLHAAANPAQFETALRQAGVDEKAIRQSLSTMAAAFTPAQIVEFLVDTDLNEYEIFLRLSSQNGLYSRLRKLSSLVKQYDESAEILSVYGKNLPLKDLVTLSSVLFIDDKTVRELSRGLGLGEKDLTTLAFTELEKKLGDPKKFLLALCSRAKEITKESLEGILLARERAIARWFQTVGPNVTHVFSGVLAKPVPCLPGLPGVPVAQRDKRLFPDFMLVVYEGNTVKAQQIGLDGLASTDQDIYTIPHSYEGQLAGKTITLTENNAWLPDPKRPSVGNLILEDFSIAPTSREATLRWKGKSATLSWDPGF